MVLTLPSTLARAKYEPDEPFVIILGCIPSDIARLIDWTKLYIISIYMPLQRVIESRVVVFLSHRMLVV
jgi:hypothetical protein